METVDELKLRTKVLVHEERYHWRDAAGNPFCNSFDPDEIEPTPLGEVEWIACRRCTEVAETMQKGW